MKGKIIYDYSKLKGLIIEKCGTQLEFADRIGLSDRSVTFKINNKRNWTQENIEKALDVLDLSHADIPDYFFVPKKTIYESNVISAD